jgi:superfamily I DNA and/or RNA helicase
LGSLQNIFEESCNNDSVSSQNSRERLLSLIEFAQHSARLKLNPAKEVTQYGVFHRFEHDLIGLSGVRFNVGDDQDEIWLTVDRLLESHPPQPKDSTLAIWLELSNKPEYEPTLKHAIDLKNPQEKNILDTNDASQNSIKLTLLSEYDKRDTIEKLFHNYVEHQWKSWAIEEKKRRRTIKFYSELFTLKQQFEGSIEDTQLELVWGMGIGIWKTSDFNIKYPLITQLIEICLNEKDMTIEIRPRQTDPRVELEVYMSVDNLGVTDLEKAYNDFLSKQTQVFSPFDRISYETQLQLAVTHLDPKGIYWPNQTKAEDRQLPASGEELKITNTWVLFARPRSKSLFIQDLENFKKQLNNNDKLDISSVVKEIVTEPSTQHKDLKLPNFRGLSSIGLRCTEDSNVSDLFFPLPFNEEQISIVQKLEHSNGVVVQGPPGTGKTHTIANIISHYMANGKRVLVTSMKEAALSVLKDKLPEAIRPLAISLLTNEQDGMKQFEFAVSKIAQELQIIDRHLLRREIESAEQYINQLHAKLAWIDRSIDDWAKKNIHPINIDEQSIYPEAAAQEVTQFVGQFEWLDDKLSITPEHTPKFTNADIARLREARRIIAKDIDYLDAKVPEIAAFPEFKEILQVHQNLSKYNELTKMLQSNNYPPLNNACENIFTQADILIKILSELAVTTKQLDEDEKERVNSIKKVFKIPDSKQILEVFETLISEINNIIVEKNEFLSKPVFLPTDLDLSENIIQAISNKSQGKSAFGLTGLLGKGQLKKKIDKIYILGSSPKTPEEWLHVYKYVLMQRRVKELILRWNTIAFEISISTIPDTDIDNAIKIAKKELEIYKISKECHTLESYIIENSRIVCPAWAYHHEMIDNSKLLRDFRDILECHFNHHCLSEAWISKENLQNIIHNFTGRITESLKQFINNMIGNQKLTDHHLQTEWSQLMVELRRIIGYRSYFADIKEICERITQSGATKWAARISNEPLNSTVDMLLPDNWQQAWRLCRLANYLQSANDFDKFKKLTSQRLEVENQLSKTYQDVVAKRTWLKLADNATPDIRAALQAFQAAIARIGRGTGKRASRYRKDAKNAASITNRAIPCWIMPHYRISESLPPELGCFDLVVIDEASQSDLSALPAMLRAAKLLVVGDDKQVSPEGVGLEEEKIRNLMIRFLSTQVDIYRQAMSPERSIYDLCKVVFADSQIMLREHFRCVTPIIEYSKREFYNHELRPLRLPKKSERLDPPLIDVIIEDGYRSNKANFAEAKFIVDEIKKICADPEMENRTIGVVSLLGNEQSRKIWDMLQLEISPDELTKHKITCGDALTFQGKERNIMFLSMVVTKGNCKADSREASNQRFNVAASRARDRMYLIRSIEIEDLSLVDKLRRKLIAHFSLPFSQDETTVKNLRELCESGFECDIYDILTERGYRVIPQVKVGGYRIDMVVEGHNDARLAIECDGDRYHDTSRWEDDMNRQRILERAGWKFWRCFASTFALYRDRIINDLTKSLTEHGIEPIGGNQVISSIHSEQRRVKVLIEDCITKDDETLNENINT